MRKQPVTFLCSLFSVLAYASIVIAPPSIGRHPGHPERRKPSAHDLPFNTVDSGTDSGISTRESLVIRSESEWLSLWRNHTVNRHPQPPAPTIDFPAEMVVAVFSGQRSSGGYAIRVDRIRESGTSLVVTVTEASASPGSINTMAMTQPYHIVRLARNSLPVIFQGM